MRATAYVVGATPRTGSSLLCEGLSATGTAGFPNEPFAPDFRAMWLQAWGLPDDVSPLAYAAEALRRGTAGGVTAIKIQWMHIAPLAESLGRAEDGVLSWLLPNARYVHVVRRDRVAQALSWFRAIETNEWWRFGDAPVPAAPDLDVAAVYDLERHIANQDSAWRAFFERHGIEPLVVEYEALAGDYRGEVARVLSFLGLPPSAADTVPAPRLRRQADGVTEEWRRRVELVADVAT
jgi:trehalose 2-sulfotransferase